MKRSLSIEQTLAAMSPVVRLDNGVLRGVKPFTKVMTGTKVADLAAAQADALDFMWPAAEKNMTGGLPRQRFRPGDLKTAFARVGTVLGLVQIQKPIILPSGYEQDFANAIQATDKHNVVNARSYGPFGDDIYLNKSAGSMFGLLTVTKLEERVRKVVSIPTIVMEAWILNAFIESGQVAALKALQRCVEKISHDYYHHLVPVNDNTFFSVEHLDKDALPKGLQAHFSGSDRLERFDRELLKAGLSLQRLNSGSDLFEVHAFITHIQIFERLLKNEAFSAELQADIQTYMSGIKRAVAFVKPRPHPKFGGEINADTFITGAAGIMAGFLLRAIDPDHPIMRSFANRLNANFEIPSHRLKVQTCLRAKDKDFSNLGAYVVSDAVSMVDDSYGLVHAAPVKAMYDFSREIYTHNVTATGRATAQFAPR